MEGEAFFIYNRDIFVLLLIIQESDVDNDVPNENILINRCDKLISNPLLDIVIERKLI